MTRLSICAPTLLLCLACSGAVQLPIEPVTEDPSADAEGDAPAAEGPAADAAEQPSAEAEAEGAPASRLRPASALTTDCFGWPGAAWTRQNSVGRPATMVNTGDPAIDFTLRDREGTEHRLADLLQGAPVLLVQGSYTCPRYQETEPDVAALATEFADQVQTVLVYNMEAHPKGEANPYHGVPKEHAYSDRPQPDAYEARVKHAADVEVGSDVLVLVDALGAGGSNPVWCSYGTCPSCAWLIRQDGVVEAVHLWTDPPTLRGSIQALLGRDG